MAEQEDLRTLQTEKAMQLKEAMRSFNTLVREASYLELIVEIDTRPEKYINEYPYFAVRIIDEL